MSASASPRASARTAVVGGAFHRQLVVLSAAVTALAVVLLTVLVQLVLARSSANTINQVLAERATTIIGAIDSASASDAVVVPDAVLDAGVAVYDSSGRLVAGAAPTALDAIYADLGTASGDPVTREVDDTSRILAQPFALGSGTTGVVVVDERLKPYEKAESDALAVSVVTGLLAVLASAALAAWVSRRALRPVVEMASTAGEWSEHDLGRRFALGGPANEMTALGDVLDGLLDKVAAAIRSEQRLTSELAHELRTPLTAIRGTADLVLMRPDLADDVREDLLEVVAAAERMAGTITGLLDLARSTSSETDTSVAHLPAVVDQATTPYPSVTATVPDVVVGMPETLVARAIGPILENAVRVAEHVHVSVVPGRPGYVAIAVDDDGPGVADGDRERIFEAGRTIGDHAGSGLGLSLSRRIARTAGGDVRLEDRDHGSRFVVELPRA